MGDFLDSQTTVILAIAIVVLIWFLSFPSSKRRPRQPKDYHF
ncbi:MAG TPA: hypothetical protein VJI13_01665 [Candidatus Norongarragalinales archaeon]|nr:hypothetical protein [Candidatus Norongarragalinales archaeon]